jgi:hypothetical protein
VKNQQSMVNQETPLYNLKAFSNEMKIALGEFHAI